MLFITIIHMFKTYDNPHAHTARAGRQELDTLNAVHTLCTHPHPSRFLPSYSVHFAHSPRFAHARSTLNVPSRTHFRRTLSRTRFRHTLHTRLRVPLHARSPLRTVPSSVARSHTLPPHFAHSPPSSVARHAPRFANSVRVPSLHYQPLRSISSSV